MTIRTTLNRILTKTTDDIAETDNYYIRVVEAKSDISRRGIVDMYGVENKKTGVVEWRSFTLPDAATAMLLLEEKLQNLSSQKSNPPRPSNEPNVA